MRPGSPRAGTPNGAGARPEYGLPGAGLARQRPPGSSPGSSWLFLLRRDRLQTLSQNVKDTKGLVGRAVETLPTELDGLPGVRHRDRRERAPEMDGIPC